MTKRIIAFLLATTALIGTSGCLANKSKNITSEPTSSEQIANEPTAPVLADETVSGEENALTTEPERTTDPDSEARERDGKIYEKFLLGGELKSRTQNVSSSYIQVSYSLIDLNDDDVHELVLKLTNTKEAGARGYPTECVLYTIADEEPLAIGTVSSNGSSDGGDIFDIRYDQKNKRHVLVTEGEMRDSAGAVEKHVIVHSVGSTTLSNQLKISAHHFNTDYEVYYDKAEEIMASTSFYTKKNDTLYYWVINNKYVSEADYDSAYANLVAPTNGKYQYKKGKYYDPIKE